MKILLFWNCIIPLLILLSGCDYSIKFGSSENNKPLNSDLRGFYSRPYPVGSAHHFSYSEFIPTKGLNSGPLPLLVYLNWGGLERHQEVPISVNFGLPLWEVRREFPFVVLGLQCTEDRNWSTSSVSAKDALMVLDEVIQKYNIDTDRIYLTGVSAGGSGTFAIGSAFAERFAALVPLCGSGGNTDPIADSNLPVWHFCNEGDTEGLVDANRKFEQNQLKLGRTPIYTEFHKEGHNVWEQGYRNKALFEWLLSQSKEKNQRETEKFRLVQFKGFGENRSVSQEGEEIIFSANGSTELHDCGEFPNLIDFHVHLKYKANQTFCIHFESLTSPDQIVLHLPFSSAGHALLSIYPQNLLKYVKSRAQNQLDEFGWNDIRIRLENDKINVMINGFPAAVHSISASQIKTWKISLSPAGPVGSELRIRRMCWRPLTWLMTSINRE